MTVEKPFVERRAGNREMLDRISRIEVSLEETRDAICENRKMHEILQSEMQDIKNLFSGSRYALIILGWIGAAIIGMLTVWQWVADHFIWDGKT